MRDLQTADTTIDSFSVYLSPSGYPAPLGDEPVERAYVAPINLETKGALEPKQTRDDEWHSPPTLLKIAAGGEEAFAVDLFSLRWGRVNAAQLPSQKLGSVEPGKYTIYVGCDKGRYIPQVCVKPNGGCVPQIGLRRVTDALSKFQSVAPKNCSSRLAGTWDTSADVQEKSPPFTIVNVWRAQCGHWKMIVGRRCHSTARGGSSCACAVGSLRS